MRSPRQSLERADEFRESVSGCTQGPTRKRSKQAVEAFEFDLEKNLVSLRRDLLERTYLPGPFRTFTITDPKPRLISAAPYRDRVVHHALCNVLEPIFERSFVFDSYACRRGHTAAKVAPFLTATNTPPPPGMRPIRARGRQRAARPVTRGPRPLGPPSAHQWAWRPVCNRSPTATATTSPTRTIRLLWRPACSHGPAARSAGFHVVQRFRRQMCEPTTGCPWECSHLSRKSSPIHTT